MRKKIIFLFGESGLREGPCWNWRNLINLKAKGPRTQACEFSGLAGNKPVTGCWWAIINLCTSRWYWSKRTPELLRLRIFTVLSLLQFNENGLLSSSAAFFSYLRIVSLCDWLNVSFIWVGQFCRYFSSFAWNFRIYSLVACDFHIDLFTSGVWFSRKLRLSSGLSQKLLIFSTVGL